jgi:hypothetical protein
VTYPLPVPYISRMIPFSCSVYSTNALMHSPVHSYHNHNVRQETNPLVETTHNAQRTIEARDQLEHYHLSLQRLVHSEEPHGRRQRQVSVLVDEGPERGQRWVVRRIEGQQTGRVDLHRAVRSQQSVVEANTHLNKHTGAQVG